MIMETTCLENIKRILPWKVFFCKYFREKNFFYACPIAFLCGRPVAIRLF